MALPDGDNHVACVRAMINRFEDPAGWSDPVGPGEAALYVRWLTALLADLEPLNESRQDR